METIWTIFKVLLAVVGVALLLCAIYQFGKACDEETKRRNGYD